ncbi:MAG TPA: hypothetical protein VND22_06005 [Actinomycetota bacterium]|nr:hypothetical protein [Actinomycetota bacterium]
MKTRPDTLDELRERIARRISDNRLTRGAGSRGQVKIALLHGAMRTFRAHWTGFKLMFPGEVLTLRAELSDGSFWSEGYISADQASWVLTFRQVPHKTRGSGGPRPDDSVAAPQAVDADDAREKDWQESGVRQAEELIRMEDFDDPAEAVDAFFYYTSFYVLKSVKTTWAEIGYEPDPSVGWDANQDIIASLPIDAAIDEGLKKSDIIWITLDSDPEHRPVPCWYVYTKEKRLFVLSGEVEQRLRGDRRARNAHVVTRWKGRDVRMAEFDAAVRVITGADNQEFREIGELLLNKRQSVTGTFEENIQRLAREAVILELSPRE